MAKARLEGPSFEMPVRQAHRLLRMSGGWFKLNTQGLDEHRPAGPLDQSLERRRAGRARPGSVERRRPGRDRALARRDGEDAAADAALAGQADPEGELAANCRNGRRASSRC